MYGLLYDTVINIYKPFGIKLLERLGGGVFHISLYNSLPGIVAALALLPGSIFISGFKSKKRITCVFFAISRFMLLSIALVPLLPDKWKPMAFVVMISLMNFPESLSQTSLQSFLGNVFDGRVRAQAITLRNKFGNVVVPIVTLITGLIISYMPANDQQRILYYQIFFVSAFIVGIAEIFIFNKFKENVPESDSTSQVNLGFGVIKEVLADKKFRKFVTTSLPFYFFWQAGWPLCGIYYIQNLHANEMWLAVFTVSSCIGAFFASGFWRKIIYKHGNHRALLVSALMIAVNIFLYPASPNTVVMTIVCLYAGFASIGVNSSLLNGLLESTSDKNRIVYLGVYNTIVNLSLFLSPLLSNVLLENFGIVTAFLIVGCGRFLGAMGMYFIGKKS